MTPGWFLDTNLFVHLFDDAEPDKQRTARTIVDSDDASRFVVSTQVLSECYVALTRKLGVSEESARAAVTQLAEFPVVTADRELVLRAMVTSAEAQLSYWDAMIVEAAASAGCDRILTEDLATGSVLRGMQIVNPLA